MGTVSSYSSYWDMSLEPGLLAPLQRKSQKGFLLLKCFRAKNRTNILVAPESSLSLGEGNSGWSAANSKLFGVNLGKPLSVIQNLVHCMFNLKINGRTVIIPHNKKTEHCTQ